MSECLCCKSALSVSWTRKMIYHHNPFRAGIYLLLTTRMQKAPWQTSILRLCGMLVVHVLQKIDAYVRCNVLFCWYIYRLYLCAVLIVLNLDGSLTQQISKRCKVRKKKLMGSWLVDFHRSTFLTLSLHHMCIILLSESLQPVCCLSGCSCFWSVYQHLIHVGVEDAWFSIDWNVFCFALLTLFFCPSSDVHCTV